MIVKPICMIATVLYAETSCLKFLFVVELSPLPSVFEEDRIAVRTIMPVVIVKTVYKIYQSKYLTIYDRRIETNKLITLIQKFNDVFLKQSF